MAKRQSTSNARGRRNRPPVAARRALPSDAQIRRAVKSPARSYENDLVRARLPMSLEQALEDERGRLAEAQSVLGCLHVALLYAEDSRISDDPDFANAAGIALKLVREAAHRLDATFVNPLVRTLSKSATSRKPSKPVIPRR